jgi:hypothetical protein
MDTFIHLIGLILLAFVISYWVVPILISFLVQNFESFVWEKYNKDWNILGEERFISRHGNELLDYLKKHGVHITDVIGNPNYDNDGLINTKKLINDIEKNKFNYK